MKFGSKIEFVLKKLTIEKIRMKRFSVSKLEQSNRAVTTYTKMSGLKAAYKTR